MGHLGGVHYPLHSTRSEAEHIRRALFAFFTRKLYHRSAGLPHVPLYVANKSVYHVVPFDVKTLPAVPGDVTPVPPYATPIVLLFHVLFVSVAVLVAVSTLLGVMMPDSVAINYSGLTGQLIVVGKPACCGMSRSA